MEGEVVEMSDAIAKRMGFINLKAFENYQRLRETADVDRLLVRLVNVEQMVIELQQAVEGLNSRLISTGCERIG